jgi:hypothetical protein
MAESHLEMANRHVARGREIVIDQQLLIERLKIGGGPTREAERLLETYEYSLRVFEDDLESILAREDK